MNSLSRIRFNIGIGWFGLILCIGLLDLPFRYFLKDNLKLTPSSMAWFFVIANIPTYIKPLIGFFTDTIRIWGTKRKYYLIFGLLICSILYFFLGYSSTINSALINYFSLSVFQILLSIILGALIVEYGKKYQITGGLSALRVGVIKIAGIIVGPIGGYLAIKSINLSTSICALLTLLLIPFYFFTFKENSERTESVKLFPKIKLQFKNLIGSKALLLAALLIFLLKISPGFGTPLFYHQTEKLKFSSEFIGVLSSIIAIGGIIGAVIYNFACKAFNLRTLLIFSISIDALDSLIYLGYDNHTSALMITVINGITGILAVLPLYDLSARATPKNSESLGYALMLSVWNLADSISDVIGSKLYDNYHWQFQDLIWINSITTALILIFIPMLPKNLISFTDKKIKSLNSNL